MNVLWDFDTYVGGGLSQELKLSKSAETMFDRFEKHFPLSAGIAGLDGGTKNSVAPERIDTNGDAVHQGQLPLPAEKTDTAVVPAPPAPENLPPNQIDTSVSAPVHTLQYLPPENENPLISDIGLGFGVPYGVLGAKAELGGSLVSGFAGIGIVPIAWDAAVSVGGSIHFLDRYGAVRPKLSVCWSNVTDLNLIYVQEGMDVLYKESFPGLAIYAGVDFRLGESDNFELDLNVGGVIPSTDINEIRARYQRHKNQLNSEGWLISDVPGFGTFPKISVGINYVIGRSLQLR
jgi:hypothetical protein